MQSPTTPARVSQHQLSRATATGSARPDGEQPMSDSLPPLGNMATGGPPYVDFNTPTRPVDGTWPRKATPPATHFRTGSGAYREPNSVAVSPYNDLNRMSAGPSIVQSSMSTVASKTSLNQRRNRGFKAAILRIFGSKRHTTAFGETRQDYYHSDPSNLTSPVEKQPIDRLVTRRPSQPMGNATRSSALGSHSPFATLEDVKESKWKPPDDWMTLRSRHKRRNTLPSVVLSQQEAQMIADALRPVDHRPEAGIGAPENIHAEDTPKALKRRSRSADALNNLAESSQVSQVDARRRSDEIAYWRNSVVENPVPDVTVPSSSQHAPSLCKTTPTNPVSYHRAAPSVEVVSPMQTFDFGLAGSNEDISLEQRVSTLEVKVVDFEYAIAKLQGHEIPRPSPAAKASRRRSIHDLFPTLGAQPLAASTRERRGPPTQPPSVFTNDLNFLSSSTNSPSLFPRDSDQPHTNRPGSATTIRPSTGRRRSPRRSTDQADEPARLETDHFERIMVLVKEEQAARHRLESHVRELQREIDELRAPVYAYIRPAIPTPSPDSMHHKAGPGKGRILHRTPAFPENPRFNLQETSRFSTTDAEDEDDGETETEDGFQDVFETPRETRFTFSSDNMGSTGSSPRTVMI